MTKEEAARIVLVDECVEFAEADNDPDSWAGWIEQALEDGRKGTTLEQYALQILRDREDPDAGPVGAFSLWWKEGEFEEAMRVLCFEPTPASVEEPTAYEETRARQTGASVEQLRKESEEGSKCGWCGGELPGSLSCRCRGCGKEFCSAGCLDKHANVEEAS